MRLRNALALTAGTATTAVITAGVLALPALADDARPVDGRGSGDQGVSRPADQQPTCGKESDPEFPIRTRVHGGPASVRPGSGFQGWRLDLTNTTPELCHHIHPVVILTDRAGALAADRVAVEFHDPDAGRWRAVSLERTGEDELVGAVDDGFQGFVVPAGRTVTVEARLSFAAGTAPGDVTVNTAVVQRKGDDGDWVGESGDWHLAVTGAASPGTREPADPARPTGAPEPSGTATAAGTAEPPGASEQPSSPRPQEPDRPDQLASTGSGTAARIAAVAAVIAAGAGIVLLTVRRSRLRRR
ncbi:hypothetical protein [Streptomyces zhihengii]|uniref:Gram-positive cocci surface proteins LPxTG domain-containing protein n=1 Tax=Streptomyces zhihengii TaxID=1818004 RepID=A0ABS2UV64_9ACTN|nr:hypothetical protein [Streptomyces zhihengii]MBM9621399.1 hypothetical protein [Streptomyces zhihengii]